MCGNVTFHKDSQQNLQLEDKLEDKFQSKKKKIKVTEQATLDQRHDFIKMAIFPN